MNDHDLEVISKMKELYVKAGQLSIQKGWSDYGYETIWEEFWDLKKSLSFRIDWCDPDSNSEEEIKAYWKALCSDVFERANRLCQNPRTRDLGITLKKVVWVSKSEE